MKKRNELPDINLDTLPFVAFEDRANLPSESCIYFVRDKQGAVLYIGKATNARSRWGGKRHSIYDKLSEMSGITITYLLCPYIDFLHEIEKAFIVWFCPDLNDKCTPRYRLRGRELSLVHTLASVLVQSALFASKPRTTQIDTKIQVMQQRFEVIQAEIQAMQAEVSEMHKGNCEILDRLESHDSNPAS